MWLVNDLYDIQGLFVVAVVWKTHGVKVVVIVVFVGYAVLVESVYSRTWGPLVQTVRHLSHASIQVHIRVSFQQGSSQLLVHL